MKALGILAGLVRTSRCLALIVAAVAAVVAFAPDAKAQAGTFTIANAWDITITASGGGVFSVDVDRNFSGTWTNVASAVYIDDAAGYYGGGAMGPLTFVANGATLEVHMGTAAANFIGVSASTYALVHGLAGADFITGSNKPMMAFGWEGGDSIAGGSDADELYGHDTPGNASSAGDDTLSGLGGADWLEGSGGDDFLFGDGGDDVLYCHEGDDEAQGGTDDDEIYGDAGMDDLFGDTAFVGGGSDDLIYGGTGDDFIFGEEGEDTLYGEAGDDCLDGSDDPDDLFGGDGMDYLHDMDTTGGDTLNGDADDDLLHSNDGGIDTLDGGTGTNAIYCNTTDTTSNGTVTIGFDPTNYGLLGTGFVAFSVNYFWKPGGIWAGIRSV